MKKNQALISELVAVGFGISICLFGFAMPLVLGFMISVARLVFCMPSMWSGFRVSLTLSVVVFLMTMAPEMAFATMAYGLSGAIMGQTAKQILFPPNRLKTRFPKYSYATLLFFMTCFASAAQTVQYLFYGKMYRVSAGRLQEHLILTAFAQVKEMYEKVGLWNGLGVDESLFVVMAKVFRACLPTQIVLSGFLMAIVGALVFTCVIPMATVFKKILRKNWSRIDIPLSWLMFFVLCVGSVFLLSDFPNVLTVVLNIIIIMASVIAVSGFGSVSRRLEKHIPSAGLRCFALVLALCVLMICTGVVIALGLLLVFAWIDSYQIYKNNKKKVS